MGAPAHWTMSMHIPSNYYANGAVNNHCPSQSGKSTAIFKKRFDRIDWKKLAAADVEHIAGNLDYNTLQENIHNVAFCNIDSELDLRMVDPNFVKLYKLAQLTIEYLLFSQEYLNNKGKDLDAAFKREADVGIVNEISCSCNERMQQAHKVLKKEFDQLKEELAEVKKESHKRKKMILAQQQMLQNGQNSYNKCPYCSKAFVNASFLQSHLLRRHLDSVGQYNSLVNSHLQQQQTAPSPVVSTPLQQQPVQQLSQSTPVINVAPAQNTANEALERQLQEIRERLQSTETQLTEERNARNNLERKEQAEQSKRNSDLQHAMEQWKAEQLNKNQDEMDRVRDMFMKELKEMNEKLSASEQRFFDSQKQNKKQSNLGIITDDVEHEKEQLAKQREEVAELREHLKHQTTHVEELLGDKLSGKDREWEERMHKMQSEHEKQLDQLSEAYQSGLNQLELDRKRHELIRAKAERKKLKEEKEREKKQREKVSVAPEPSEPKTSVETSPLKSSPPLPQHSMTPDDDEATEDLETTLGGTSTYGTRTFPTFGTGTLSISETRNGRLADILKQNPDILRELKSDLNGQLDHALEQRGIKPGTQGIPTSVFNGKMQLLKGERQQRALKYKNYFDIRQHYLNQVDALAKDRLKAEAAAAASAKAKQIEEARNRPTSAPHGAHMNGQQDRLGQSAPLPSTAMPSPKLSKQPPRPAPRVTSPLGRGTNGTSVSMSMTSTGQSSYPANTTGTSSQWDSELDEEEEDEDETETALETPKPKVIPEEDDDIDEVSFLEDISDLEEMSGVGKPNPVVTVPRPSGEMVAELSRSIELQLQGRGKKPAGAINTVSLDEESSATDDHLRKGVRLQDDDSFPSLTSEESEEEPIGPKPILKKQPASRSSLQVADSGSYSTNTYNTSMWGGSSSKAGSTAIPPPGASIAKTSMNVSEGWDSDDDIEELAS
ncbi:hypothetical protein CAPTEDRAFT_214413 [Capitella teleta]|uniref:C2H2-type domain-containing protein n=1 Tax=Capitella teleta TaxID=283909 RepID=R7TGL0_CAPTE|nr:hypothetical protein CAPTEDRAFT_214413 [Capitella teleta]|eukprot:ELT92809.1 hypothetical protein CAPTEDRAFT_214413 [Capitella teleta]